MQIGYAINSTSLGRKCFQFDDNFHYFYTLTTKAEWQKVS